MCTWSHTNILELDRNETIVHWSHSLLTLIILICMVGLVLFSSTFLHISEYFFRWPFNFVNWRYDETH